MEETRKRVVGTAGHIDHGKTTLVRALTGVDTDRLPEEKRRGITIDLGFARLPAGDVQISFIDVPGHERFVKNMLAGVGGIDSALLVVAADESIKPQTREHFAICRLLRIPTGVVAINKSDLVDEEIIEIVRLEVEDLVRGSFLEGRPVIPVSATTGAGIEELREAIIASVRALPDRDPADHLFRLPIDRAFTMHGFGAVVTGTTISGSLAEESDVEILPEAMRSRARKIQVHGEPREIVKAGERTSINLTDVSLHDLHRGQQVVPPATLRPSQVLTARLELLEDATPLKDQTRVRFHHYSAELLGSIRIVGSNAGEVRPGTSEWVQLRLETPVVAVAGDRFVIRRYSPAITIGGGVIVDPHLGRVSRGTRSEIFETLESAPFGDRVALMARLAGIGGISADDVQARTGLKKETIVARLEGGAAPELRSVGERAQKRWIHDDHLRELRRKAITFLEEYFRKNRMAVALPKGELIQKLLPRGTDAAVAAFVLDDLVREKIIVLQGDQVDVPGRSRALAGAEGELAEVIETRFREAGLKPPLMSDLYNTIEHRAKIIEGVVGYLVKTDVLRRLADGIYVHRDALDQAQRKLQAHRGELIDVGWFKDLFGLSRKIAIPLLEYFDRRGVTKRIGDQRRVL